MKIVSLLVVMSLFCAAYGGGRIATIEFERDGWFGATFLAMAAVLIVIAFQWPS